MDRGQRSGDCGQFLMSVSTTVDIRISRSAVPVENNRCNRWLAQAEAKSAAGKPARIFKEFSWLTRKSWIRERRVIGVHQGRGQSALRRSTPHVVIRLTYVVKAPPNRRIFMLSLVARPNHAIKDFLCAAAQYLVSAGFQCLDCFHGRGIWHPHIEWQSAAKHDLTQEHGDRIGGAYTHFREHPGRPRFEFRLYPRR
jgi:hypothetical protein